MERVERHAGRLRRDAARLGLAQPARADIESLLLESARKAFGRGDGIVRIEWSATPGSPPELIARTRALGPDPDRWRVGLGTTPHPGPELRRNTKFVHVSAYELAREQATKSDLNEVMLFDRDGHLVEGGHSNFLVVTAAGALVTPELALGGVEGLGLTLVLESQPETGFARLTREDLQAARELMSVNAVRGVVPIVELEGRPVAAGIPGPWSRRLRKIFFRDFEQTAG